MLARSSPASSNCFIKSASALKKSASTPCGIITTFTVLSFAESNFPLPKCVLNLLYKLREFGIRKVLKKLVISLIICTFIGDNQQVTNKVKTMITKDKVTEIFCIIDEFNKNLNTELENNLFLPTHNGKGKGYRNRKGRLSESEIMTILVCYHFGTYRNFKEYYLNCIRGQLKQEFPDAVSYNRFVELMPRVFFRMMMFMKLYAFGK